VPGERSRQIRVEREQIGIPIHPGLAQKLNALARDLATEGLP
jgi:LDH2 family malate/lactate/ureidoglycolate dehydrogenase